MSVTGALPARYGLGILILGAAALAAGPAAAVDVATFVCEDRVGVGAGVVWGSERGKCLVECQRRAIGGDPRVCSKPPGFDGETQACVESVDDQYRAAGLRYCASGMPACYAGLDPVTYVNAQIALRAPLVDGFVVPFLLCDPAAIECEAVTVRRLNNLARGLTRCLGRCYRAVQLQDADGRQCTPDTQGDPFDTLDPKTEACVRKAITRTGSAITRRCQPLPGCGLYLGGLPAVLDIIISNIVAPYANPNSNPYCTL